MRNLVKICENLDLLTNFGDDNNSLVVAESSEEAFYDEMIIDKEIFDDDEDMFDHDDDIFDIFDNNENMFGEMFEDIEMVDKDVFEKSDEMVDDEGWIDLSITDNSR
ncbi:hypothetical protein F8M41_026490 [Gigaspora margarita]|uniref:Uncharacterized protein n=1 Tax=Gigaspora margarita TaxID=4874 RepID=A0A8H4ET24_GIGMA|nr:hypothetical protein F8M41_026490 [Gigaspora margarita]